MNEFLNKLQAKIRQLMWGRYGNDELSSASLGLAFILLLINTFIKGNNFLMVPVEVILIWVIFRSFSKNIYKRQQELNVYLRIKKKFFSRLKLYKRMWNERNTHRYFRCDQCKSFVRVPKGKGQIEITCPKCRNKFIKRS